MEDKQQENPINPFSVSSAHLSVLTEAFLLGQPFPHHIKAGADLAVHSPDCVIEFRQRLLIPLPIKEINLKDKKEEYHTCSARIPPSRPTKLVDKFTKSA